jgi:hypothetical protein
MRSEALSLREIVERVMRMIEPALAKASVSTGSARCETAEVRHSQLPVSRLSMVYMPVMKSGGDRNGSRRPSGAGNRRSL